MHIKCVICGCVQKCSSKLFISDFCYVPAHVIQYVHAHKNNACAYRSRIVAHALKRACWFDILLDYVGVSCYMYRLAASMGSVLGNNIFCVAFYICIF